MATGQPGNFSLNILSRQRRGTRYGRKARVGTPQHIDAETRAQLLGMVPEQSAPEMSEAELTGELSAPATPENLPETEYVDKGGNAPSQGPTNTWGQPAPGKTFAELQAEQTLMDAGKDKITDMGKNMLTKAGMNVGYASYLDAPTKVLSQVGVRSLLPSPRTAATFINELGGSSITQKQEKPGIVNNFANMSDAEIANTRSAAESADVATPDTVAAEDDPDPMSFNPAERSVQTGRQSVRTSPGLLGHAANFAWGGIKGLYNKAKGLFSPTDAPAPQVTQEVAAPPTEVSTVTSPAVPAGIKELPPETRKALMGAPQETGGGGEGGGLGYGGQSPTADVTTEGSNLGNIAMDDQINAMIAAGNQLRGDRLKAAKEASIGAGGGLFKDGAPASQFDDDWTDDWGFGDEDDWGEGAYGGGVEGSYGTSGLG